MGSGSRCSRLGDWLILRSSHLPPSFIYLPPPPPSPPQIQPGGVTGTLNLGPHQSAQRKNFGPRPLATVTRKAWPGDPRAAQLGCPGLPGARVGGSPRRGAQPASGTSGMTWARGCPPGTGPRSPGASGPPRLVLVYNSGAVSMSCIPRQKLFPRISALRVYWCLLRAGLLQ